MARREPHPHYKYPKISKMQGDLIFCLERDRDRDREREREREIEERKATFLRRFHGVLPIKT